MKENVKRVETLMFLSNVLFKKHKEELFINDYPEWCKLCFDVIKHEAEECGLDDIQDVEIYFVKNTVKGLYTFDSLKNKL